MRGRILGVATFMKSFDFLFGVLLGETLLRHSDNLSKALQASTCLLQKVRLLLQ